MKMILTIAVCGMLGLCSDKPVVSTPPPRCADLIPPGWENGVEGEPVPDTSGLSPLDQIKAWAGAYVGASGQTEKANGRTRDTIHIMKRCEELARDARPDG